MRQMRKGALQLKVPFTLTRITKGPIENEKGKRKRKRKRIVDQPRELVLTIEHEKKIHSQERGGFEAHSEQIMLSPTTG